MNKIWSKYREFFVILIYVIVVFCIYNFIITSLNSKMREDKRATEEKILEYEISKKKLREVPILKKKIDSISILEKKLDVFADLEKILPLIKSIEKIADETGNKIDIEILDDGTEKNKKASSAKVEEGIIADLPSENYVLMKLELSGDFNSIYRFIKRIEKFEFFSDIIALDILKEAEKEQSFLIAPSRTLNFVQTENKQEDEIEESVDILENPLKGIIQIVLYTNN